ncbi:MAG: hypothetical protein ACOC1P_05220 [Minisyncoccales bacterium]
MEAESTHPVTINFSVPMSFLKIKEEADKLVEKDPGFKDALEDLDTRYQKKTKQNKYKSFKLRYYIAFYLKERKKQLKREEMQNAERSKNKDTKKENT